MTDAPYITDDDKKEYQRFVRHHIPSFARLPPREIWHYTSAEGLIAILSTGKLFSTQVTCLNDNLEQKYFGDLILAGMKKLIATKSDPALQIMLRVAIEALSDRDFSSAWHFAICFSEVEDDLGQWRGYGGGECGYAIGFNFEDLFKTIETKRKGSVIVPMNYDLPKQQFLVDEVIGNAEKFFLAGSSKFPDTERWAREFLAAFSWELDIFACLMKHPKFASENERRIVIPLQHDDFPRLEFRQKRTLLARHLPIDLRSVNNLLPITRIFVGPGPAQRVSQVSVAALLQKSDYTNIPVELSAVPYRIP
jgi:hypothetical protein